MNRSQRFDNKNRRSNTMREKRKQERRSFDPLPSIPFSDSDGKLIFEDRRRMADRRLNNIWLELVSLEPGEIPRQWSGFRH